MLQITVILTLICGCIMIFAVAEHIKSGGIQRQPVSAKDVGLSTEDILKIIQDEFTQKAFADSLKMNNIELQLTNISKSVNALATRVDDINIRQYWEELEAQRVGEYNNLIYAGSVIDSDTALFNQLNYQSLRSTDSNNEWVPARLSDQRYINKIEAMA